MNLGTLFVRLNSDASGFIGGMAKASGAVADFAKETKKLANTAGTLVMAKASGAVADFAKETKKLANDVAETAGTLVAMGGAAFAIAASADAYSAQTMDGLKKSTELLAVQVADILTPAVNWLSRTFRELADDVASLDPRIKDQAAEFATYAVKAMVAFKALGVGANFIDATAGALESLTKNWAKSGLALGPVVIAIAGVVAAVIFLHRAWRQNWGGIQDATGEAVNSLGDAAKWLADIFAGAWNTIVSGAESAVSAVLNVVDALGEAAGKGPRVTAGLREGFAGLFKDLKTGDFFRASFAFAKTVAQEVGDAALEEIGIIQREFMNAIGNPQSTGKRARGALAPIDPNSLKALDDNGAAVRKLTAEFLSAAAEIDAAKKKMALDRFASQKAGKEMLLAARSQEKAAQQQEDAMRSAGNVAFARATCDMRGLTSAEKASAQADDGSVVWDALAKGAQNVTNWWNRMGGIVQSGLTSVLGEVGQVINDVVAGAQAGGVWGAVIAFLMDILKRLHSVKRFADAAIDFLQVLADALEPVVSVVFGSLRDVLDMLKDILPPIFQALKFIFDIVAFVVKAIVTVVYGIIWLINGLFALLGDKAAQAEVDRYGKKIDDLWNGKAQADRDAADAARDNADAQTEAANAARGAAESLTNVPSGYKLALSRWSAMNEGSDYSAALDGAGGGGGSLTINGDVTIQAGGADAEEVLTELQRRAARIREQRGGSRFAEEGV